MIGKADREGSLTGADIYFVHPDFRTAIKGDFVDSVLMSKKRIQCQADKGEGPLFLSIVTLSL